MTVFRGFGWKELDVEALSVVYRIPCTNCPRTYIGQTGRTLTQRLKEHQRAVRNADTATLALLTGLRLV